MLSIMLALTLTAARPPIDPAAERIGAKAHADAAVLQKLPRFDYQARHRWGYVEGLRAVDQVGLPELTKALDGKIAEKPKSGEGMTWYESGFAWDETRFLQDTRPGESILGINSRFGTRTDGWSRDEAADHSGKQFTRRAGVGRYWREAGESRGILVESSYLRLTPQKWWWGESHRGTGQSLTHRLFAGSWWVTLPAEPFAGEQCDVVELTNWGGRFQRLWVGKASGRVRGVLTFYSGPDDYGALVRFDDYREVTPGVWVPFTEAHIMSHSSDTKGKSQLLRAESRVTVAQTGTDLAARYAALLPELGDTVQDQRFAAAVNTKYDPTRPDADIQAKADAAHAVQLEDAKFVKELIAPIGLLVGKPALPLPADGWVGGKRPDLAGKPYLLHFWATWCGPCKDDLPQLAELAAKGVVVVGLHPSGTPAEDVAKVVADRKLGYPTLVAAENGRETVAGYPAAMFPYCIVVDAKGSVAAHGTLHEIRLMIGQGALTLTKP